LQSLVFFVLKTIKTAAARRREKIPFGQFFVVNKKKYLRNLLFRNINDSQVLKNSFLQLVI